MRFGTRSRLLGLGAVAFGLSMSLATPASACAPLTIYFDWNSANISEESRDALGRMAVALAWKGPDLDAVELTSHTDNSGSAAANRELAWARARAVRDILLSHDVPERLIVMEAAVSSHPRVQTPRDTREPANRRVELFVQYSADAQQEALKDGAPIC